MLKEIVLKINNEQCDFIIRAIDSYIYTTSDVMSYDEIQHRRTTVIDPIFEQLPDELF